jgi:hypothetical protein
LSILRRSPQERVAALEQYPDRANMPSHLVYELILNLAEFGDYDQALSLFHNRFFQREEGGTNVRDVWLEVQLQRAMSLAHHSQCSEAVNVAEHLADKVPDLAFTHDGLEPLLRSGRISYLLGNLYRTCNLTEKAQASFKHATEQSNLEDGVWSWKASQELPGPKRDAGTEQLEQILQGARSTSEISSKTGWWLYNIALLDRALGRTAQSEAEFRDALLFPDQMMTYHLTRVAISSNNP